MTLNIELGASASALVDRLADRLRQPQADPFAPDWVVVSTVGHRHWLTEELGVRLAPTGSTEGILTNVRFLFPNEFNLFAVGAQRPADSPWDVSQLTWTILGLLDDGVVSAPGFSGATRPVTLARRIAELFDRYSVHRPEMLEAWRDGHATDPDLPLADEHRWQVSMWRAVRDRLGPAPAEAYLAARREASPGLIPGRLSVFGLELFSHAKVDLLAQLGAADGPAGDIAVYAVFPAVGALDVITTRSRRGPFGLRKDNDYTDAFRNVLSRSWAVPGAEAMALLAGAGSELVVAESATSSSHLGDLQTAIVDDRALPITSGVDRSVTGGDGSIQVHLCHGPTRQVEVLRDAVLHLMAADPTLTPRDILVICPNLERFGPLLEPLLSVDLNGQALAVTVLDPAGSSHTPIAAALMALLEVVGGRLTRSEVAGLLAHEPIRLRFGFTEDEVATATDWFDDLGVRWGLNPTHRSSAPWNYPGGIEDGTWQQAVDRLTAGVLIQSVDPVEAPADIVPFDDLGGSDIATVGRVAAFVDRLTRFASSCREVHTASAWAELLDEMVDACITAGPDDADELADVRRIAERLRHGALSAPDVRFGVGEVQAYVTGLLSGGGSRSRQWADAVRVGSLTRLRGVPSRVVAILGFDDDAFRSGRNNGDDVLGVDPRIGERDFGAEQRLGLLATLCSATDNFIVTANGHDVTNNKRVPLAVALEELLDAAVATGAAGDRVLDRPLVIDHARQEFDPVNVGLGSPDPSRNVGRFVEGPWTFDPTAPQVAAEILAGERGDGFAWPTLEGVGESADTSTCSIGDLVDAVRRPTRIYLRRGLQVAAPAEAQVAVDELPLWPGSLEESSLGLGLIDALRVGDPAAVGRWERLVRLQGRIPPGALGDRYLAQLRHEVDLMVAIAGDDWRDTQRIDIDVVVDSAGAAAAWTLRGSVDVVGTRVVSFRYSKGHPRHQLLPLVELAALTVQSPDTLWEAAVITRAPDPKKSTAPWTAQFRLKGPTPAARLAVAHDVLHFAHATFVEATRAPVPLFERSSWRAADSGFAKDLETDLKDRSNALVFASDAEEDRKGFERWVRARGAALLELWERSHVPVLVPADDGGAA